MDNPEKQRIDLANIHYVDEPDTEYIAALDKALTPAALTEVLDRFGPLFPDAKRQGSNLSDEDFLTLRSGLRKERRGKFAGEEFMRRFGAVLLPENMMRIGMVAEQFGVPFGLAFSRLKEVGELSIDGNVCTLKQAA